MSNVTRYGVVEQLVNGQVVQVPVTRDWFAYTFNVSSIANGATSTATINIQADANFICEKVSCFADISGEVQTVESQVVPLVTVMLTDSGSGRSLFNAALPIASICGPNLAGENLPFGRCFSANSNISAVFTNYSNATTYANLYLTLHGYKEWNMGRGA